MMGAWRRPADRFALLLVLLSLVPSGVRASVVRNGRPPVRLIVLKFDGLPPDIVDEYVRRIDPRTGRSVLPWVKYLFYDGGIRFENFYARGMSLSTPSWAIIDTGQHGVIKGNYEVNRNTGEAFDYLNLFNYYYDVTRERRVYPESVEALDAAGIPLVSDAFGFEERETGIQLMRRGTKFYDFLQIGINPIKGSVPERLGDWIVGADFERAYNETTRKSLVDAIRNPNLRYVDFYGHNVDHMLHDDNDPDQITRALREMDQIVGEAWAALLESGTANRTVFAVVSDHGLTFDRKGRYSHGVNLVSYLNRATFGAHNVLTRQGSLPGYSLEGTVFKPVPRGMHVTRSSESSWLAEVPDQVTCIVDNDGNERMQIQFRSPDLNRLQMLHFALRKQELSEAERGAAGRAAMRLCDRYRERWTVEAREIREELQALDERKKQLERELERARVLRESFLQAEKTGHPAPSVTGVEVSALNTFDPKTDLVQRLRELKASVYQLERDLRGYAAYCASLETRIRVRSAADFEKQSAGALFGAADLGARPDAFDLRAYPSDLDGIVLGPDGELDDARTFKTVDYTELFVSVRIANTVYPDFGSRPVEFVALELPVRETASACHAAGILPGANPDAITSAVLLAGGGDRNVLLLGCERPGREPELALVPVAGIRRDPQSGQVEVTGSPWRSGLPVRLFEDRNLDDRSRDRAAWLSSFRPEREWFQAVHATERGLTVVGLPEVYSRDYLEGFARKMAGSRNETERLYVRFERRRRLAQQTDLFLHAEPHWHFNVKDFNPGANHGGFTRSSMHAVFWMRGGSETPVKPGPLSVDTPLDGLDVAPALFEAAGLTVNGVFSGELRGRGFQPFPGRVAWDAFQRRPLP